MHTQHCLRAIMIKLPGIANIVQPAGRSIYGEYPCFNTQTELLAQLSRTAK